MRTKDAKTIEDVRDTLEDAASIIEGIRDRLSDKAEIEILTDSASSIRDAINDLGTL